MLIKEEKLLIAFSKIIDDVICDALCPMEKENKPYCYKKAEELLKEVKEIYPYLK